MRGGVFWSRSSLDRGILVYARSFESRPELTISEHYQDTDVVYFKDGNNATISVRKGEDYVGLRTNGKVDASNKADMITQLMIGYLPDPVSPRAALHDDHRLWRRRHRGSDDAHSRRSKKSTVSRSNRPSSAPVPQFAEFNRKSYENPKVHIMYDDARNYMNVTRKQYDVIISEPSNPWIAGVASLFTSEFYERAAQVLKPDGVFAQWIQLYELDPEDLRMILREVQDKFPTRVRVGLFRRSDHHRDTPAATPEPSSLGAAGFRRSASCRASCAITSKFRGPKAFLPTT